MGDPCQVDKVAAGMRPFKHRANQLRRDVRQIGLILKKNGATAALSHITNSIADFIDSQHAEITRQAMRERSFVFEKKKITGRELDQIRNVWGQNFIAETRHMSDAERTKLQDKLYLFSLAETDVVPSDLKARLPKTVASFMAARNMFAEFGSEMVERGMFGKQTGKAMIEKTKFDAGGGEPEEIVRAGGVPNWMKQEAARVYDAHKGKYWPVVWNFETQQQQSGNGPLRSGKLDSKADRQHLKARTRKIVSDEEAAKYTKEERIKQNIWGITRAKEAGLETDLIKVFVEKAPQQLNLLTVDRFAESIGLNWARSFAGKDKTQAMMDAEAKEAGFVKVKQIINFSSQLSGGVNKQSPPNVKMLAASDVYIHKDIADDLNEILSGFSEIQQANRAIMNAFKTAKTLPNPGYHTHNFGSQAMMASWSPHFSLTLPTSADGKRKNVIAAFTDGIKSYKLANAGDAKEKALMDLAIEYGVYQPNQDRAGFEGQSEYEALANTTLDKMQQANSYTEYLSVIGNVIKGAAATPRKLVEGATNVVKGTEKTEIEPGKGEKLVGAAADATVNAAVDLQNKLAFISNMSDQMFKYGAFKHYIETLKFTPEQAANEIDRTFVRYDTLPKFAQKINRYSAFYSFNHALSRIITTRIAESLRAIDQLAKGEIDKSEAYDKTLPVLKMVSTLGALGLATEVALMQQGFDEQERELWRNSTPSIDFELMGMPFSTGIPMPGGRELNATYFIPIPFGDVFFGGGTGQPLPYSGIMDSMAGKTGRTLETLLASNPATTIIAEAVAFEDFFTGKETAEGENILTAAEKGRALAMQISEKFTPYIVLNTLNYLQNREVENVSKTGAQKSFGAFFSALMGAPMADWGIEEANARATIELKGRINTIDALIRKQKYAISRNRVSKATGTKNIKALIAKRKKLVEARKKVRPETLAKARAERQLAANK